MKALRPYQQEAIEACWNALIKNDEPVLLMASVGAGKSLMLASILLSMQKSGKRALCLVNNAELVRNNHATLIEEGGDSSIYCAALDSKDCSKPIIFGTPVTILNGITKNEAISRIKFNLIVVDEAHCINYRSPTSCFMRILRHYKTEYQAMRLLGATGTNYRFKGAPIVGDECLFKSQVGNITTEALIKAGYLIKPHFEIESDLELDFSHVKIKSNGLFDQQQLEQVITKSTRLTELICKQLIHVMESQARYGVFIFATTKKHAYEILSHLPADESALILGETPQDERTTILNKARIGEVRYLVNIAIISVGVDVPAYDTIAYLRPTESLVLLVQTMGRALRLSPTTHKTESLVLDFAGNIERHRDWDNPLLLEALKQTVDKDKPLVIQCPACQELNTEHARRCIGIQNDKRCDYYFEYKACPNKACGKQNDIAARFCRFCQAEIIDPNKKLSLKRAKESLEQVRVIEANYSVTGSFHNFRVEVVYRCCDKIGRVVNFFEHYCPLSDRARRLFYGQFVKQHCVDASRWYVHLHNRSKVLLMLQTVKTPDYLMVVRNREGSKIRKKIFTNKDD